MVPINARTYGFCFLSIGMPVRGDDLDCLRVGEPEVGASVGDEEA